jgi:hypothetical protein
MYASSTGRLCIVSTIALVNAGTIMRFAMNARTDKQPQMRMTFRYVTSETIFDAADSMLSCEFFGNPSQ